VEREARVVRFGDFEFDPGTGDLRLPVTRLAVMPFELAAGVQQEKERSRLALLSFVRRRNQRRTS
jgi:hypothetical protein